MIELDAWPELEQECLWAESPERRLAAWAELRVLHTQLRRRQLKQAMEVASQILELLR